MNDPNALVYGGDEHRLYAQHCPQPNFGPMGRGCFTSDDLLDWRWADVAFAPTATQSVFSGSAVRGADGKLDLYYTLYDRTTRLEMQHRNRGVVTLDPSRLILADQLGRRGAIAAIPLSSSHLRLALANAGRTSV